MRKFLCLLAGASLFTTLGWLMGARFGPSFERASVTQASGVEYDVKLSRSSGLPHVLLAHVLDAEGPKEDGPAPLPGGITRSASRVQFEGKTFWVVLSRSGMGISYYTVAVYAPAANGESALCFAGESCGAGWLKPELEAATGQLVFREHARSELEGQVILSCNLRSVGNYHSVYGK
jgi:hypothetical protein